MSGQFQVQVDSEVREATAMKGREGQREKRGQPAGAPPQPHTGARRQLAAHHRRLVFRVFDSQSSPSNRPSPLMAASQEAGRQQGQ